jgi:hypothetical protein
MICFVFCWNVLAQDALTKHGWKLLYDVGVFCAFALFINAESMIPIAHVWEAGKPRNFFIHPVKHTVGISTIDYYIGVALGAKANKLTRKASNALIESDVYFLFGNFHPFSSSWQITQLHPYPILTARSISHRT